jgi:tyrosine-protein phosphatase YwqE
MNINAPLGGAFSAQSRWARKLLKTEQIDYIASDMHDSISRGPHTKGKIEAVSKIIGLEYLQKLLYENCEKIVGDV